MELRAVKTKIRRLKRIEIDARYGREHYKNQPLLWNAFFDLKGERPVKYPLSDLLAAGDREYKRIAGEFLSGVYSDLFSDLEAGARNFDKDLLVRLDLPYDADIAMVKKRFRQLVLRHHPDTGGDAQKFIEIMEIYRALTGKRL